VPQGLGLAFAFFSGVIHRLSDLTVATFDCLAEQPGERPEKILTLQLFFSGERPEKVLTLQLFFSGVQSA
jgi:hypothetical protein